MNNFRLFTIKIFILGILVVGMNYFYKYFLFEKDIQAHSDIINLVRKVLNDKSEIVYFGESSNTSCREDDTDKRPISDMISDYYPALKFGNVTKPASHAGIFYGLLQNIPADSDVKTVIVTLNLRSFDASWIYSNLETPLQKSIVLLKDNPPLYNRFLLAFKGYDIKSDAEREKQFLKKWRTEILHFPFEFKYNNVREWDRGLSWEGIKNADGSRNQPLTELACHYIKTYAFQIDTLTNPRIKDFDKIVYLAQKRNWNLILNLMAENTEMADSLVGKELVFLINQNAELLVKRYSKNNVLVVNNLNCVGEKEFTDRTWTTEHYAEKGRKIVARNVAEGLKSIYPKEFKPNAE